MKCQKDRKKGRKKKEESKESEQRRKLTYKNSRSDEFKGKTKKRKVQSG
jgi:hypothetical protein